ncbi:MAG TPA: hypothetical protein PKM88_09760 [bacterium]|nr:hypothetical protein [bacterium]
MTEKKGFDALAGDGFLSDQAVVVLCLRRLAVPEGDIDIPLFIPA